jgi:TPR repeat protein
MKKTLISAAILISSAANAAAFGSKAEVIAVLEVRSRLSASDRKLIDAQELTDQIRETARRALPEARVQGCGGDCDLRTARELGASRALTSELLRADNGFLVSLDLYDTSAGKLLNSASAIAATPEELIEAVAGAVIDLVRPQQDQIVVVSMGPDGLPDLPEVSPPPAPALHLGIDANLLVAYDKARSAEARGRDHPDEAALAWRDVAHRGGRNPFRDMAAARANQWETYAATRRAYQAQLASDSAGLRKSLPLPSVTDAAKLDALLRFARAYGVEKATPMLGLLAAPALRSRAETALGCEARDAAKCLLMAHAADEAKDPKAALQYLDDACSAGAAEACAESGDRWLRPATRDAARAIAALQRGCAAFNGLACARLARVYEEGDGTAANALIAGEMRDKACAAGDGRSCRQRACTADTDNRALELWQMGCSRGDAPSCALAQLAAPRPSTPAPESEKTAAKPAAAPPAVTAQAEVSKARQRLGVTLVAVGVLAAASAAFIAAADGHEGFLSHRFERFYSLHREAERSRKGLMYAMGAAALLSGGVGVAILLTRPEPAAPQVRVGIAPGALLLSGTFP